MSESMATLMEAAAEVARLTGEVALRYYRTPLQIEHKRDGSPVTAADREAEQTARAWIERRFPQDGVLGEELGLSRPEARRRWLIDPIDGTRTFVRGVPLWGALVGVIEDETVLAGAASFPALDELLAAGRGQRCFLNGTACTVSDVTDLAAAAVVTTDERFSSERARRGPWQQLAARAALSRSWGDCYGYLLVATGRAEVMVDPILSPWDAAAVMVLVEEAGGVFTDWDGRSTAFGGSAIATNRGVAAEARAVLAGTAALAL